MTSDNASIPIIESLTDDHVSQLFTLCLAASDAILTIYNDESLWQQTEKPDQTPVTAADLLSSDILVAGLPRIVDCPVVSEEALPDYEERRHWSVYWLIDPIDGTREFLHKTDEFVINIALMQHHQPVFGFMFQPTTSDAWWGGPGFGAFKGGAHNGVNLPSGSHTKQLIALGSRRSKWQGAWRDALSVAGFDVQTQSVGSALKFVRLAEGLADLYPRLGPTSEWDTAAPQAILQATGGAVRQWDGSALEYGKRDTLNPHFIAVRDQAILNILTVKSYLK